MTVKERICDSGYEDIIVFKNPSYDSAFIGVSTDDCAVYDFDLMVEYLVLQDGISYTEAIEFIEYNTIRALPYYENAPIIVNRI